MSELPMIAFPILDYPSILLKKFDNMTDFVFSHIMICLALQRYIILYHLPNFSPQKAPGFLLRLCQVAECAIIKRTLQPLTLCEVPVATSSFCRCSILRFYIKPQRISIIVLNINYFELNKSTRSGTLCSFLFEKY